MIAIKTPTCVFCGKDGVVHLTDDQAKRFEGYNRQGPYIQDLLPDVSADVREQLMTGTHPKCWDEIFGEEDDDE